MEFITSIHLFDKMKEFDQKFIIPEMTEDSSCFLPTKDKDLLVEIDNLSLIFCKGGEQLTNFSFLIRRETPRNFKFI